MLCAVRWLRDAFKSDGIALRLRTGANHAFLRRVASAFVVAREVRAFALVGRLIAEVLFGAIESGNRNARCGR